MPGPELTLYLYHPKSIYTDKRYNSFGYVHGIIICILGPPDFLVARFFLLQILQTNFSSFLRHLPQFHKNKSRNRSIAHSRMPVVRQYVKFSGDFIQGRQSGRIPLIGEFTRERLLVQISGIYQWIDQLEVEVSFQCLIDHSYVVPNVVPYQNFASEERNDGLEIFFFGQSIFDVLLQQSVNQDASRVKIGLANITMIGLAWEYFKIVDRNRSIRDDSVLVNVQSGSFQVHHRKVELTARRFGIYLLRFFQIFSDPGRVRRRRLDFIFFSKMPHQKNFNRNLTVSTS